MKRMLVIGGGLTGLSAAWHTRRAAVDVRLLESSPQIGGVVQTIRENGYLAETGPNSLQLSTPAQKEMLEALGLGSEICEASPSARNRFVVRAGQLVPVPLSPWQFLSTPLLSTGAKWRLLREPWIPTRSPATGGDESVADFVRRRLGPEVLAYAVEPFTGGVYAAPPDRLVLRHAFPRLKALEDKHGSLGRAALKLMWERRQAGEKRFRSRSISFREGMAALPRALAAQLGKPCIITEAKLNSLLAAGNGRWTAAWDSPSGNGREEFDAVVIATPAHAVGQMPLPSKLLKALAPLTSVEHPPLAAVVLGYPQAQVRHALDGFGVLLPSVEPFHILGTLFTSSLFPGRAPAGHVTLTTFVGGARWPEFAAMRDEGLLHLVQGDLEKLLGARGTPTYQRIVRWSHSIPQYGFQHDQVLAALKEAERAWPGLALAGSYRGGVSVTQCLENGRLAAEQVLNQSLSAGKSL
jgi:oxygen-dependent protoporphyrinogen oxidase